MPVGTGKMLHINNVFKERWRNIVKPIPLMTWVERSQKHYLAFLLRSPLTLPSDLITCYISPCNADAYIRPFQLTTLTVSEFEEGSERLDAHLQSLANKLNSNQAFQPDDSFTMETTFIPTPAPGSGNGKPSNRAVRPFADSPKRPASQ